jgi:aryl-alcohol dehydrogenase-like predicted oxidoreductase
LHELRGAAAGRASLDEEQSRPFIKRALDLGINFLDTPNSYSDGTSGEILGRALREFARRDEVVIATKVYYPTRKDPNGRGLSRKAITGTQELWGSGHVFSFFGEETKNMA